jgi:pyruvate dehydrogenase E1 component
VTTGRAARRARARGKKTALSQIERLMEGVPRHAQLITVTDGHPATLAWIGGVKGHAVTPLGVEHFGQTGTIRDLYRHFMIDADAIVSAASHLSPGKILK